ncbi:hypothetical protein HDU86_004274 [Geranomyces michiganensis]|nr:hypothetical protein HDU86_004274 [Geranomyces michiganensis]
MGSDTGVDRSYNAGMREDVAKAPYRTHHDVTAGMKQDVTTAVDRTSHDVAKATVPFARRAFNSDSTAINWVHIGLIAPGITLASRSS